IVCQRGRMHPSNPSELRRFSVVATNSALRHLLMSQNQLNFKIQFLVRKEPRNCAHLTIAFAFRQEIPALLQAESPQLQPYSRLLVPHGTPHHGATADLFARIIAILKAALHCRIQTVPGASELLDFYFNPKIVSNDLFQSCGGTGLLSK